VGRDLFTTAGSERMVIDERRYVGIGTAYPGKRLHIYGAGELLRLQATAPNQTAQLFLYASRNAQIA
jgi:hypothetical protein